MIGVIVDPADRRVVGEFFELFKTSWEFYRNDRKYEVLLCTADCDVDEAAARTILIYAGRKLAWDTKERIQIASQDPTPNCLLYRGARIPIYGKFINFPAGQSNVLVAEESRLPTIYQCQSGESTVTRIGYDLLAEITTLLTTGQPAVYAGIPALELHIALLRDLIIKSGASLAEVPPVPRGYRFIACLTHDVDHPLIRRHRFDHTTLGFLYRATVGSVIGVLRRKWSMRRLVRNLAAVSRLPLVHLGLARDFWANFGRYTWLEEGVQSTFFLIPFKGRRGHRRTGQAPGRRAAGYGAADVTGQIQDLVAAGCEIGMHGIDAWWNSSAGVEELEEVRKITGSGKIGVRMHWLYFDEHSPAALESAGADYDSTVGYNETVGYRAGTTQAYKPLGVTQLLELPLHIMDTALFYPAHLNLSPEEAHRLVSKIIDNAVHLGGCVTVNWHDRSIAPERCWDDFYVDLVRELKRKGAWFATAGETVAWFRKRRAARFEGIAGEGSALSARRDAIADERLPDLQVRLLDVQELLSVQPD